MGEANYNPLLRMDGPTYLNSFSRGLRRVHFTLLRPGEDFEIGMKAYGGDKESIGYGNRSPILYQK